MHEDDREGGNALPDTRGHRIVGISPDGRRVDNVTSNNRHDVHKNDPWLKIHLMTEDLANVLHVVYIPRTREMPDIAMFGDEPFEVYDTRLDPPQYKECMVARAVREPPKEGQ